MNNAALLILMALMCCVTGCSTGSNARDWYQYGSRFPDQYELKQPGEIKGGETDVIVEGTIDQVCKSMGCWLTLRDASGNELWVQTKDHRFFVPRNAEGRTARVHGRAERAVVSVDQLKHFAADAQKSQQEIDAIDKPVERVTFYADSVIIQGQGLDRAVSPVQ